jgi:tetratricopeptide (TPR) repeat protein
MQEVMGRNLLNAISISGIVILILVVAFRKPAEQEKMPGKSIAVFCSPSFDPTKLSEKGAPLFKGLGNLHYAITTKSADAQKYFNQGLTLLYSFNHGEAGRSFMEAIRLDSTCAMAYWGMGMVLGPNYNMPLNGASLRDINEAMDKAVALAGNVSPKERALILALAKRFPREDVSDMTPYNAAYAQAMKDAYEQFPGDMEIATLYADALMNEHPWDLWEKNGTARPWTPAIIDLLEKILAKEPNHAGANHLYIHAIEASPNPGKALPSADRLQTLLPAAGHMVHMPSHIYIRTGYYHKGVVTNENAVKVDSTYIAQCKAAGFYPMLLYPHNIHFLAACAFLEGNSKKAIDAAWMVSRKADRKYLGEVATVQHYYIIPYYVMVHMAKWDDILKLPIPGESLKYPRAIWHYARGMAYVAKKDEASAAKELAAVKKYLEDESLKEFRIWDVNSTHEIISIAALTLEAELKAFRKQYDEATELLKKAVAIEDGLMYQEPPDWFFSVRHTLGHVLVQAGRYEEAEKIYREDLTTYPENGWALIGLYNALKGQSKTAEAAEVKKRFDKAWKWADVKIESSRIY